MARRDVRRFRPDPVPDEVLWRLLDAAHHAPSVGFMQPWDFIIITDREARARSRTWPTGSGRPLPSSTRPSAVPSTSA